ncbi:ABC transporter permease [Fodinicola acaciae]|uniref:ABC transporter permease n=1 Tax=Fodinicola acaciae TaxID=2681555 RepID=UPI0013D38195|nr:ABC transporter permease [Fodinicola acaciae]
MISAIRRMLPGVLAALLAVVLSLVITSVVLAVSGAEPFFAFGQMVSYGFQPDSLANIVNNATTYYLSALAVAIGFKMKLFNIGVDGQYRLAAMLAASVAGFLPLPPVLAQVVTILVAVLVGGLWAGIAGLLKVTRGVSEVISTIMLNFIATGIVAYLLQRGRLAVQASGSNNIGTPTIPPSGRVPGLSLIPGTDTQVFGLIVLAVIVGVGYHVLVNRSRFGFDLRATGQSASAAIASGVSVKRMTVATMLMSGALAGMVGLPQLLGSSYTYSLDFPAGLGFTGIAIALLGRNNPVGIAFGAVLWAFLDQSSLILDLNNIPKEIVIITQGTVVLCVVVAYELVRRLTLRQQQKAVGRQLAVDSGLPEGASA